MAKTEELSFDRPPRTAIAGPKWRVARTDHCTQVWFTRDGDGAPLLTLDRCLTDEELDLLRLVAREGLTLTAQDVPTLLRDPRWQAARLRYYQAHAPQTWKDEVAG